MDNERNDDVSVDDLLGLVWYANGSLSPPRNAQVQQWLAEHPQGEDALRLIQTTQANVKSWHPHHVPGELGLRRVLWDIKQESGNDVKWWRNACAVVVVAMMLQASIVPYLMRPTSVPIEPLAGETRIAIPQGTTWHIRFVATTKIEEVQTLLRQVDATIIKGPLVDGGYRIVLPDAQTTAAVKLLQDSPSVLSVAREQ